MWSDHVGDLCKISATHHVMKYFQFILIFNDLVVGIHGSLHLIELNLLILQEKNKYTAIQIDLYITAELWFGPNK